MKFLTAFLLFFLPLAASAERLYVYSPNDGFLNLRQGPSTSHKIIKPMYNGTSVTILGRSGNWLNVRHQSGSKGWAYKTYLIRKKKASSTSTSTQGGVLPAGHCTIVVASRSSLPMVRRYALEGPFRKDILQFYEASNGWYAISVGTYPLNKGKSKTVDWKNKGEIPNDSHCSTGSKYVRKIPLRTVLASSTECIDKSRGMGFNFCAFGRNPVGTAGLLGGIYIANKLIARAPSSGRTSGSKALKSYQCTVVCTNSAIAAASGIVGSSRRDISAQVHAKTRVDAIGYAKSTSTQICQSAKLFKVSGTGATCR